MRVRVITSCTGEKSLSSPEQLTLADFRLGAPHVQAREAVLRELLTPAEDLYSGLQHVRLMRGVRAAREASSIEVDLQILSAGYGLVVADQKLAPYEATFIGMGRKGIDAWAQALGIPSAIRVALAEPCDLCLVLLGKDYLRACALDEQVQLGGPTLFLCGKDAAQRLPKIPYLYPVVLANPEATTFSCGLVGLKGEVAARVLENLAKHPELLGAYVGKPQATVSNPGLPTSPAKASTKPGTRKVARVNSDVDRVIELPDSWRNKPHREKLRYFIPEWDDLVDPDYDFERDEHSGGTGDWSNQVYAHQMYPEPNYDGILISKVVAEKSKKKKERINAMGVHRFLRVPRRFPIMGDCGAFGYINQDVPPYSTDEILDYYTRLDFDLGVSVDHLIVAATESKKRERYELTIQNAEDFLREHTARALPWTPVGAVQGWDPKSYADAAGKYVKMGYTYLGLGGLVRSTTRDILDIVFRVREKVPPHVSIHLFGIARVDAMKAFADAGVQSVDSASYLRQAWMRLHQSYASMDGPYAALRIPEAGKSFRAKHMRDHPELSDARILTMEQAALRIVRAYGQRKASLDTALETLLDYDRFVTKERISMEPAYRRTLEDRPWEQCPCAICQNHGIEVAIFRGNNRNRRRGFHNTWVFYRLLQKMLAGESVPFVKQQPATNQLEIALL